MVHPWRTNVKKTKLNINMLNDISAPDKSLEPSFEQPAFIKGKWVPNLTLVLLAILIGLVLLWLACRA